MAHIHVNIQAVQNHNCALYPLLYQLEQCERAIAVLRWRMDAANSEEEQIREELSFICKEIEMIKQKVEELYRVTDNCMEQYIMLEAHLDKAADDFI